MAGMYAVWHGPEGLTRIARRINLQARLLAAAAQAGGATLRHDAVFDTISLDVPDADALIARAVDAGFNLRRLDGQGVAVALDETVTRPQLDTLATLLGGTLDGGPPPHPPPPAPPGGGPTPQPFRNAFSATRSWLTRSTAGEGRTGRSEASRSRPSALTFSNSKVMTSTTAAKRRSASGSSNRPSVAPALTRPAGLSARSARICAR